MQNLRDWLSFPCDKFAELKNKTLAAIYAAISCGSKKFYKISFQYRSRICILNIEPNFFERVALKPFFRHDIQTEQTLTVES